MNIGSKYNGCDRESTSCGPFPPRDKGLLTIGHADETNGLFAVAARGTLRAAGISKLPAFPGARVDEGSIGFSELGN